MVVAFWILVGVLVGIVSNVVSWALFLRCIDGERKDKDEASILFWCLIPFLAAFIVLYAVISSAIDDKKRRKRV